MWYASELPIIAGPWKLHGLPGLILRAADDAGHEFLLLGLSDGKPPLYQSEYRSRDLKTVDRFLRYERFFYLPPFDVLNKGEDLECIVTLDRNGRPVINKKDWTIPYPPLELE